MLKKISTGVTALAVLGSVVLAATPASAQHRYGGGGWHGGGWHGGGGWRGGGWRGGYRHGGAVLGGLAAGALIGGALAARPYYYSAPAYTYDYPAYSYDEPSYAEPAYGDDDAYCSQRFRSYDPASGTYLGYDGLRHSCP